MLSVVRSAQEQCPSHVALWLHPLPPRPSSLSWDILWLRIAHARSLTPHPAGIFCLWTASVDVVSDSSRVWKGFLFDSFASVFSSGEYGLLRKLTPPTAKRSPTRLRSLEQKTGNDSAIPPRHSLQERERERERGGGGGGGGRGGGLSNIHFFSPEIAIILLWLSLECWSPSRVVGRRGFRLETTLHFQLASIKTSLRGKKNAIS